MGDLLHPQWLDNAFLSDCLQNERNNKNLTVTDFNVESAVPPGNNFGSIVARVKVNYRDEASEETNTSSKSLIMKLPLTQGGLQEFVADNLDVEPCFYNDYLPKAYAILKQPYALRYYPSSSTIPVVALEDLKESGFVMVDKKIRLKFDECQRFAEAAAALHGTSLVVLKKHPEFIERLCSEKVFSDKNPVSTTFKNLIRYGLDCTIDRVSKLTDDTKTLNILKESSAIIWDLLVEVAQPKGDFLTINHGDPWTTNMMFKHDAEGHCEDIKLIDFQTFRYTSPVNDLMYFLWTSAQHYVREDKYEEFIQTYLDAINRNLEAMNCSERLSLEFFKKELLRASPIALYIVVLPFFEIPGGAPDMGSFFTRAKEYSPENNPLEECFTEDFCKIHLLRMINQMKKFGTFDYLEERLKKTKQ